MIYPTPDLSGWLVFCDGWKADRHVNQYDELDVGTGEVYYEWTGQECGSTLLTITRAIRLSASAWARMLG
jgi:hypothetical protein